MFLGPQVCLPVASAALHPCGAACGWLSPLRYGSFIANLAVADLGFGYGCSHQLRYHLFMLLVQSHAGHTRALAPASAVVRRLRASFLLVGSRKVSGLSRRLTEQPPYRAHRAGRPPTSAFLAGLSLYPSIANVPTAAHSQRNRRRRALKLLPQPFVSSRRGPRQAGFEVAGAGFDSRAQRSRVPVIVIATE